TWLIWLSLAAAARLSAGLAAALRACNPVAPCDAPSSTLSAVWLDLERGFTRRSACRVSLFLVYRPRRGRAGPRCP
ncbi:LOW QUALITY PROTEIN: conserved hypothetical protein, partial [Mycobacterium tuberculosis CPHL_A]